MSDLIVDTCRVRDDATRLGMASAVVDDAAVTLNSAAVAVRSVPWAGAAAWEEPFLAVRATQLADEIEAAASVARLLAADLAVVAGETRDAAGAFEAADDGLFSDLRRLAVGTAPGHEPLVGALALMLAGPHLPGLPQGVPGMFPAQASMRGSVGSVSDRLAVLTGIARGAYRDEPQIRVVDGERLPTPRTAVEALRGVQRVADLQEDASLVAVQELQDEAGRSRWLVTVPGTNTFAGSTFGWHQNFRLMSADDAARDRADSVVVIRSAMDRAGVGPDDDVMIVGHSQGGLAAAVVAASDPRVTRLLTAGAPVAGHPLPPRVQALHVEVPGELVSALDGRSNPAHAGRVTVRGPADLSVGAASDVIPHPVGYHAAVLEEAVGARGPAATRDPGLGVAEAEIEEFLDADVVGQTLVESRLVPDVVTTEPTDAPRDPPRAPVP